MGSIGLHDWLTDDAVNPPCFGDSSPAVSWHLSSDQINALVQDSEYRGGCGLEPNHDWTGAGSWSWTATVTAATANAEYDGSGTSYTTEWDAACHWGILATGSYTPAHCDNGTAATTNPWYCAGDHNTDVAVWAR